MKRFICLGIETSCDETSAGVVADGRDILANIVVSQEDLHRRYGGIVPEIACRAHIESVLPVIEEALLKAKLKLADLTAIAVTHTPGLIGALLVGVSAAKSLSLVLNKPLIGINHIEAHLYAASVFGGQSGITYPAVGLVVSGGHTSLFLIKNLQRYRTLGATIDDAAGEAFDKVSTILGLGYPGGPAIEKASKKGNPKAIKFSSPIVTNHVPMGCPRKLPSGSRLLVGKLRTTSYDFSFSGLKTAVLYHAKGQNARRDTPLKKGLSIPDIAASFQEVVANALVTKVIQAAREYKIKTIVVGGGVSANNRLRTKLIEQTKNLGLRCYIPPLSLCTDNAAMVAGLAYHKYKNGRVARLDLDAKA